MKKVLTLISFLLVSGTMLFAQTDETECMQNLSIFDQFYKANNLKDAYEPWKKVYDNCPSLHRAIYIYGEKIVKYKIENTAGAEKQTYIEMFTELLDKGQKYFPKDYQPADVAIEKGLLMYNEKLGSKEEIFKILDKGFTEDRANFKHPQALYLYFSLLVDLQSEGKKDLQDVFDIYDDVTDKIAVENQALGEIARTLSEREDAGEQLKKNDKLRLEAARKNGASYEKISESIDAKLGSLAECDNLIPLYEKNFGSNTTDATWLKRALARMDEKDCTDDPMYVKIVEALHALQPSAESAYGLGVLNDKKGNTSEALKYYNESVGMQSDVFKKSNLLLRIALKYSNRGQKSTAYNYAQKSIDANPSNGNAYLLIAHLYASSANECGDTTFDKKAVYWRAAQAARKAGQVDPSVKGKADSAAGRYDALAPTKTEIFTSGRQGEVISFKCWMGGSIKVPTL